MSLPLMEQAKKEGIEVDSPQETGQPEQVNQPSQQDASAASSPATESSASGAVNSTSEKVPFHQDPQVQKYLDRQARKQEVAWQAKLEAMESRYKGQLDTLGAFTRPQQQKEELAPDQAAALKQLASMLKGELGLDKYEGYQQELDSIRAEKMQEGFNGELSSVLDEFGGQYGLDKAELEEDLREFIANDPIFSHVEWSKGAVKNAAILMLNPRMKELAEREINSRLLKEKQLKASNNVESSSGKGVAAGTQKVDLSQRGAISKRIQDAGGLQV